MNPAEHTALAAALAAEHAAVYAYGVVAAFALAPRRNAVAAATAAHAARRDAVTDALTADHATGPLAAPGYALPATVTDAASAIALAVTLEQDTATAWRAVLERSNPAGTERSDPAVAERSDPAGTDSQSFAVRAVALAALTDCAIRAAGWRLALGATPATTPFPGAPQSPGG